MIYRDIEYSISDAQAAENTLAQIVAANTSHFLTANRESMERFAERPMVKALDGNACDPLLPDFRDLFPHFANLVTITQDGTTICSAVEQPGGKQLNLANTEWFIRAMSEQRFLAGRPFIGPITGRWVSVLVLPIRDSHKAVKGVVGLPLDLKLFAPELGNATLAPGTRIGILNSQGDLLWRNEDQEELIGRNLLENDTTKQVLALEKGSLEGVGTDGVHRLYVVEPISEVGWYAYVSVPTQAIYEKAIAGSRIIALAGTSGLILALILAVFLARRIARPISGISGAARSIKDGDKSVRAPLDGPREVVEVAGEFNMMVDAWAALLKKLEFQANHDVLTGLPNRLLLADRMSLAIKRSARDKSLLAICFLDIDSFKAINDLHGHDIGDKLLIDVGRRIESSLRGGDTLARLGGDEFIILLNDLSNISEVEQTLLHLQSALSAPYCIEGQNAVVLSSIGVSIYPLDDSDPDTLLRHADHAMYIAKQSGKNRINFFDPNQEFRMREWHQLRDEIRLGLKRNEFILHYQPKVNMRTGAVNSAEALVRWQHPERGLLMPAEFLPAIQDNELIVDLGDWVLQCAFRQIDAWRMQGLSVRVSVNAASQQLQEIDFVHKLIKLLQDHPNVAPQQIEIEILESAALAEVKMVGKIMTWCKEIGIDFALDDFGTGYASLSYLKQLPAATLKIDQSFIRDMLEEPDSLAITEGILGLARAFKRMSIAEGVETIEHGVFLLHLGCDFGQGYGIARPMPADAVADWIQSYRPDPRWIKAGAVKWRNENFSLLSMEAEHCRWVNIFIEMINNGEQEKIQRYVDMTQTSNFHRWCDGEGKALYSPMPEFQSLDLLHRQMAALATDMADFVRRGKLEMASAKITALLLVRDAVIDALHSLRDAVIQSWE